VILTWILSSRFLLFSSNVQLTAFKRFRFSLFLFIFVSEKMFRPAELRNIFRGQSLIKPLSRTFCSPNTAEKSADLKFQDEWNSAKAYEDIPGFTVFGSIKNFMPGGEIVRV
jgi:hypothetical protein